MNRANDIIKEIESHLRDLASETDSVKMSRFFKRYLEIMSRFWEYSYHNQLLIYFAMPNATRVAGFKTWQTLGRKIKKGSKAIRILAPVVKKSNSEHEKSLEDCEKEVAGFFPVCVFDVSQTSGAPLPEIDMDVTGDSFRHLLEILVEFCGEHSIKVNFRNLGINGLYGYSSGGLVAVSTAQSTNAQVATLIHEIAHELLHNASSLSKQQKEIQAEGTAWVVARHFGLETKSFNYLALYDADYRKIMDNLQAVSETSKTIIGFIERRLSNARFSGIMSF